MATENNPIVTTLLISILLLLVLILFSIVVFNLVVLLLSTIAITTTTSLIVPFLVPILITILHKRNNYLHSLGRIKSGILERTNGSLNVSSVRYFHLILLLLLLFASSLMFLCILIGNRIFVPFWNDETDEAWKVPPLFVRVRLLKTLCHDRCALMRVLREKAPESRTAAL